MMSLDSRPTCPVCDTKDKLSQCTACQVTFYCSKEHQESDSHKHKSSCNAIKRAQDNLKNEAVNLRTNPSDWINPPGATAFEEHAGHFWGVCATRDYMRARYGLVEALLKVNTYAAVEAALNHLVEMLHLCRSDNMGLRDIIPGLFLRLGRDQEAYDFLKWWATTGGCEDYDWGYMDEPYLDLKNEDVFLSTYADLSQTVAVALLKLRILFDLQALKTAAVVGKRLPPEILDNISQYMVGNIVGQRRDIMEGENLDFLAANLDTQVNVLCYTVNHANKHFWPALLQPGSNLTARPEAYRKGTEAEMQLALQYSYNSWVETPGAIDYIRTIVSDPEFTATPPNRLVMSC